MQRRQNLSYRSLGWMFFLIFLVTGCSDGGSSRGMDWGTRRAFPYPLGTEAHGELWQVQALDVVRGDEAWRRLKEANKYNDPPPEGQEYLLVRLKVGCSPKAKEAYLSYDVTGDRGILYSPFAAVPPKPRLSLDACKPTQDASGWVAFLIGADERNLMLVFQEFVNSDYAYYYLALEEGARILADMTLEEITPEPNLGSKEAPVPLGKTLTTKNWQLTVEEVLWDDGAWERIAAANQFNDPPAPGRQYVMIWTQARYIGIDPGPHVISNLRFSILGGDEALYDAPSVVCPEPELWEELFSGATFSGWLCMEVDKVTERPLLIFEKYPDGSRYFSLQP